MPKIPIKRLKCIACNGTGVSSKGEPCYPCLANGRYQYIDGELFLVSNELGIVGSLQRPTRIELSKPAEPKIVQADLYA